MALNSAQWEVTTDKVIKYKGKGSGGTLAGGHGGADANYVTVLELHRWLQDLADNASTADDDFMDITNLNPSDKKFDTIITLTNGYTLDETAATGNYYPASEFIYGGSIIQGSGGTEAIFDGISVVANRGVVVNVIQNNAVLSNKFWNNTPSGETFAGINPDPANGVAMRFMVKVKNAGAFIDNGALLFTTREWGKSFSEFRIPSTGRGVNVVPLTYVSDLNNTTLTTSIFSGTLQAPFDAITNLTAGYVTIDLQQGDGAQEYYSQWNRGTGTLGVTLASINQFYEYMKYLTRNGNTTPLYGIPGEKFRGITHSVQTGAITGTYVEGGANALTWASGTGQILAVDTSDRIIYFQLLTGTAPGNGVALTQTAGGSSTTTSAAVERALSTPFCGASTGSSLVGAYGFALEYNDLTTNDKLVAFDGTTRNPPNNVAFSVAGILSGWRILVGPESAGALNYNQLTATTQLTGASEATITFTEAAPANTPSTSGSYGALRVHRADGSWTRHTYSAYDSGTKTFTFTAPVDFSTNSMHTDTKFFIAYIDAASVGTTISYNTVQTANQTLYIEARFGGSGDYTNSIKPAKTTGTLGSNGGSATISAVSDA